MQEHLVTQVKVFQIMKILDTQTISWAQLEPILFYRIPEVLTQIILDLEAIPVNDKLHMDILLETLKVIISSNRIFYEISKN